MNRVILFAPASYVSMMVSYGRSENNCRVFKTCKEYDISSDYYHYFYAVDLRKVIICITLA